MQQNSASSLFELDEIVWGKVIGYPYWPGQISCIFEKTFSNGEMGYEYVINFIGDQSHAKLKQKHILKYHANYQSCSQRKYKGLQQAVQLADAIVRAKKMDLNVRKVLETTRKPSNCTPLNAKSMGLNLEIELQIVLNCLTFKSSNVEYLWSKLDAMVHNLSNSNSTDLYYLLGTPVGKILKCILKLLSNQEKLLKRECPLLPVVSMLEKIQKVLNHSTLQDQQDTAELEKIEKKVLLQVNKELSSFQLYSQESQTDHQSPVKGPQTTPSMEDTYVHKENIFHSFHSAFTLLQKELVPEHIEYIKKQPIIIEQRPILQSRKEFKPIIIKPPY